ncbi:MAG TPA: cytochrome b/b6 domain-containing protein [Gryllotalpicola sp.]
MTSAPSSKQRDPKAREPKPREQKERSRWFRLVWLIPLVLVVLAVLVLLARWLRYSSAGADFLTAYPGQYPLPGFAPTGFPAWLNWQHALNAFFLILIVRTGWLVRTNKRPGAFWTRNNSGPIRTKNPPRKISIDLWLHLSLDALWVLNGVVFWVLLFCTGQWSRVIPTSWRVFPDAASALLQYASLDWPTEDGWANYNSLQQLSYFLVVFIAAPVALATGLRMSNAWPKDATRLNRAYPIELARALHFPTMLFFVLFVIVHVTLVLATGALRNLNHMYGSSDSAGSWLGFALFAVSVVVMAAAWVAARPVFLGPLASLTGKVTAR